MSRPMVIAHHLIWTVYGWWLPNDPRGSTSREVRGDLLKSLGALHFGRKRIQPASREIHEFYEQAQSLLKHPLMDLPSSIFKFVARGFADAINECDYTCYACAILPDHVHLIIRKHKHSAEQMIANLRQHSRLRLSECGHFPRDHPIWVRGGWKVFLDHPDEVQRTIRCVWDNPSQYGLPAQQWDFVVPYDNWPLHQGHSVRSPYVRALVAAGRYPNDR